MIKYLLTGSNGQLAKEFKKIIKDGLYAYDLPDLDISDEKQVKDAICSIKPDFLINCAAYNNVDKAETDYENAFNVNASALLHFSRACEKYKTKIIHFSTDFVFPGNENKIPYRETDLPAPLNKYGQSKLEGEKILAQNYENYSIFRVSWLYGDGEQNFEFKLKSWAKDKNTVKIADDEISVPTPTKFVAESVFKAIDIKGLRHLCASGFASRYEWALKIAEKYRLNADILQASQKDFNLPAKRPFFSAMDNRMIASQTGIDMPLWSDFYE